MKRKNNYDIITKNEYFLSPPEEGMPWVNRVAREHWGTRFYLEREFPNRVFIAFIQQGKGLLTDSQGKEKQVNPGSIMYLAPSVRHNFECTDKSGLHLLVFLLVNPKGIKLSQKFLPVESTVLPLADPGRVEGLFYRLLEAAEKGGFNTSAIASSLVESILLTIDQESRSHLDAKDQVFALFTRCRVYIENNWQQITSVNEVPVLFGISQPYMGKLFRKYEQCTPHRFLLSQKMSYALYELQQGQITIEKIARRLKFADAYSFSKTFKRIMGQPPSAMR